MMYTKTGILMNLRTPLRTAVMILLLILGCAMLFLGYGLKSSADKSEQQASDAYTTLAVVNTDVLKANGMYSSPQWIKDSNNARYGVVRACTAYSPDYKTIRTNNDYVFHPSNNICVLLVTCKQTTIGEYDEQYDDHLITTTFTVDEFISVHPDIKSRGLQEVKCQINMLEEDYMSLINFTPGKQYILAGTLSINADPKISILEYDYEFGGMKHNFLPVNGDWRNMLAADEGAKMRKFIEKAEISYQSLTVLATERLDCFIPFNRGMVNIVEGRDITPKEYALGKQVCMISSAFASYHKLSVGDEIPLQLYSSSFIVRNGNGVPISWYISGVNDKSEFAQSENYTIVGIYFTKDYREGIYNLTPNTIIVPKAAVFFNDYLNQPPLAEVLLIQNGKSEAFLEEMETIRPGASAMFTILDQGYSEVEAVLNNFARNANTSFLVSLIAWIILISAFILILILPSRKTAGMMRSVGASEIGVAKVIAAGGIAIVLVSVVLGVLAGSFLLDTAVEKAYLFGLSPGTETSVLFGQSGVPGSGVTLITTILNALAQFAVLCVVVCVASALTASQPVLKLLKVNRE